MTWNKLLNATVLDYREAINIAVAVFTFVICILLGRYVLKELRSCGRGGLDWPVKLSIGLFFIFAGECIRSFTIWLLIHLEGSTATYKSDIAVLMFALLLILIGGPCVIRVMSPAKNGNTLWITSLVIVAVMVTVNFLY